jgi:hypothetical protein
LSRPFNVCALPPQYPGQVNPRLLTVNNVLVYIRPATVESAWSRIVSSPQLTQCKDEMEIGVLEGREGDQIHDLHRVIRLMGEVKYVTPTELKVPRRGTQMRLDVHPET